MPLESAPWSYPFDTRDMEEVVDLSISPSPDERLKLGQHLDVDAVDGLNVEYRLSRPKGSHAVRVEGKLKAKLKQTCVVSMEPMRTEVEDKFESYYADYEQATPFSKAQKALYKKYGVEEVPVMDEDQDPEPMHNGKIDLGELAMQYLSLSIDPYPHKRGLEKNTDIQEEGMEKESRENPFEALRTLKDNKS